MSLINETVVKPVKAIVMGSINETVLTPINETIMGSINETKCAFDQSFARKAAITASLVSMLLVIGIVGCLYAQILRILVTKLKKLNKEQGQRRKVCQLEKTQETNIKYGSCKCKANTSNDTCAKLDLTHGTRTHQQEKQTVVISTANAERNIQRQRAKLKFIVMFLIIIVVYTVSYIPYHIVGLVAIDMQHSSEEEQKAQKFLLGVIKLFGFINHIVNPFIYGCFDATFKEKCKEILSRRRCK